MQKILIFSFLLSFSLPGLAAEFLPKDSYQDYQCKKEVKKDLQRIFSAAAPQWERVVDPDFETQAFRSPTLKTGEWYEFHITEKKLPKLFFYSTTKTSQVNWNKNCKLITKNGSGIEFFKITPGTTVESFGDKDLAKILSEKKAALIYIWSPRMVYSVTEFSRVRALAEKRKMEFVPILDPTVDAVEGRAAMKKAGVELNIRIASNDREPSSVDMYKRLSSVDLYMRHGTLHFPTVFVAAQGKLHPRRLVGVLTNDGLNQSLDEMMGELK